MHFNVVSLYHKMKDFSMSVLIYIYLTFLILGQNTCFKQITMFLICPKQRSQLQISDFLSINKDFNQSHPTIVNTYYYWLAFIVLVLFLSKLLTKLEVSKTDAENYLQIITYWNRRASC